MQRPDWKIDHRHNNNIIIIPLVQFKNEARVKIAKQSCLLPLSPRKSEFQLLAPPASLLQQEQASRKNDGSKSTHKKWRARSSDKRSSESCKQFPISVIHPVESSVELSTKNETKVGVKIKSKKPFNNTGHIWSVADKHLKADHICPVSLKGISID